MKDYEIRRKFGLLWFAFLGLFYPLLVMGYFLAGDAQESEKRIKQLEQTVELELDA